MKDYLTDPEQVVVDDGQRSHLVTSDWVYQRAVSSALYYFFYTYMTYLRLFTNGNMISPTISNNDDTTFLQKYPDLQQWKPKWKYVRQ